MDENKKHENGLAMSDYEIAQSWRLARDKEDQIKVLADLNRCSTAKIRARLFAANEPGSIGPVDIMQAAEKLNGDSKCNNFGSLRNYLKRWAGISGKEAKKIFKDWVHEPWGYEELEAWDIEETRKAADEALQKKPEKVTIKNVPAEAVRTVFTELERAAELEALGCMKETITKQIIEGEESVRVLREQLKEFDNELEQLRNKLALLDAVEKKIRGGANGTDQ